VTTPFHYQVVATDAAEIQALLSRVTGRAVLADVEVPWKYRYEQHVDGEERFSVVRLSSVGASRGYKDRNPTPGGEVVTIAVLNGGEFSVRDDTGHWRDTAVPILFTTDRALVVHQVNFDLTVVNLSTAYLLKRARLRFGDGLVALDFGNAVPRSPAAITSWRALVHHVTTVILDRTFDDERVRDNALQALADAALDLFAFEGTRPAPGTAEASELIARAMREIDDHLDEDMSMEALAAAVGVSPRTLRTEFTARLGCTPLTIARREKLRAVRVDLLAADSRRVTVGELADRWGFRSLGRFAAAYRAEFGELPSETLHREV